MILGGPGDSGTAFLQRNAAQTSLITGGQYDIVSEYMDLAIIVWYNQYIQAGIQGVSTSRRKVINILLKVCDTLRLAQSSVVDSATPKTSPVSSTGRS